MTEANVVGILALILSVLIMLLDDIETQFFSGHVKLVHFFAAVLSLYTLYRWLYPAAN